MNQFFREFKMVLLAVILGCAASCQRPALQPVRPPATLDFHIVVSPDSPGINIDTANEALQSGEKLPGFKWLPFRDLRFLAMDEDDLNALLEDPEAYFRPRGLVAASRYDIVYLLVFDDAANSIKQGRPPIYQIVDVYRDMDDLGRDAVFFELDERGGELMRAMTSANVGRQMACVVAGEVITAPVLNSAIGKRALLIGNYQPNDVTQLLRELRGSS